MRRARAEVPGQRVRPGDGVHQSGRGRVHRAAVADRRSARAAHRARVLSAACCASARRLGEALRRAKASARVLAYPGAGCRFQRRRMRPGRDWAGRASCCTAIRPRSCSRRSPAGLPLGPRPLTRARVCPECDGPQHVKRSTRCCRTAGSAIRPNKMLASIAVPARARSRRVGVGARPELANSRVAPRNAMHANCDPDAIDARADRGRRLAALASARSGARAARAARSAQTAGLPGSQIAALLADDRVRRLLPSKRGIVRVIGRWIVSGLKDGVLGLVREYDREQVKKEGLLLVNGTSSSNSRALREKPFLRHTEGAKPTEHWC